MSKIYRKGLALGGIYWVSLTNGYVFGQMTGMISSLQKNEEGLNLSENQISVIASAFVITCPVGYWIAAAIADKIGRRWSFILFSIFVTIYWITLYMSKDMFMFMISRTFGSIGMGALFSLVITVTSEYTSPNNRGFYLNMNTTVAPAIGTGVGHIIGIILHWRNVSLIGVLLSAVGIVLPYFWVESPHWLASRGMFTKCEQTFKKLHGDKAAKELSTLIVLEQSKLDAAKAVDSESSIKRLVLAFKRRYFWELIILSTVIHIYTSAAGKIVFSVFATVMLEDITGTSDVLLFTLLVDSFIIVGSLLSCLLIRKMNMRSLFFSAGLIANVILITLSACLYYKKDEMYFRWINVGLLALYFIILNAGPCPIAEALIGEIFPLDLKLYCFVVSGITLNGSSYLSLVFFPYLVSSMGYHGMFLLNVTVMTIILVYVWIKLPETKGRTLQEIEVYFKTKDFDVDEALKNVQFKSLL